MWIATADQRRALVRLATSTSDADAYAMAMYSCGPTLAKTSHDDCALLSSAQWAKIEPDNAVPWLYLGAEAERRRDRSGLEAALFRASKSRYSDPHIDAISRLLASDAYERVPPPVQPRLAVALLGVQAALPLAALQVATQYCGGSAPTDSRAETCGDLAALLIEHGRTAIEVFVGSKIAERIGWSDSRLSALHDDADAMRWRLYMAPQSLQEHVLLSCDSLQQLRRTMTAAAQLGEAGAVRRDLAESGVSASQAAEQWRAETRRKASEQTSAQGATH